MLIQYFMAQTDKDLVQQLDNHQYNEEALIEVKIPLNVPYISSWSDYERVDGEVELQGVFYNYVLRKVYRDTIYLKCLPNTAKTKLHKEYGQRAGESNKSTAAKKMNILSEYNHLSIQYIVIPPVTGLSWQTGCLAPYLINSFANIPWHPPKVHE